MTTENKNDAAIKNFEPLEIMGIFWVCLGLMVLAVTVFVESNPYVPLIRGILTNIVSGGILVIVGVFSLIRGRRNRRKADQQS